MLADSPDGPRPAEHVASDGLPFPMVSDDFWGCICFCPAAGPDLVIGIQRTLLRLHGAECLSAARVS